ncbi:putative dolichyl-P-Man:GDP-ManGlcNAc2-PP-dolichyl beta-1,4-mannosyltransferase [Trypanosoma rangeli]|uniref:Putative dolichyl-P-Man:GDP-ManGlcNAc2-PP-dolichyl beta-1,4-mannosyltransferase n=1 Tax=Trypanosoma rangeli TaxID=5698 RepID=A0A422P1Y6_TRYRA|nr:putative dolichyl-P-Man:GDP-ManGlcNAc2-PP-dolichyl beta-1,4-mannosyltransferase [Trypanosoma rangeli]RNF11694.1 putative dolichyl-P-Man:GDP-ManGlcNAc2-PP-dolichyl beta-1,4-mannosyltransferase [Trypanosoma rangeli]|eukprot:RNF11694.1 putative dolichyl-P-Man:GDP-ManGlcNAc2-PP-dolichyl beta-1,4-mannosyltransferase [Trypanosoma rangeli]
MLSYDELIWTISFPVFCSLAMWFSMALALLVRSMRGRVRREKIRDSILRKERWGATVSGSLRRDSKAILRRAVVMVGGDFARSPRMQYHAASLVKCGLFDSVALVGFDMGNALIDDLQSITSGGTNEGGECVVDTTYLIPPVTPPSWFCRVFPHRRMYWIVSTAYRACACSVVFAWALIGALVMVVNDRGQLLLVDLVLVQSPPAVPFVPVIKYIVRPCVFLINAILYYCFLVPGSWMICDALSEIRGGLKLQKELKLGDKKVTASSRFVICPALIVDWHNFGYTILQSDDRPSLAVWIYWMFECHCCFGDRNVTVSKAMQKALYALQGRTTKRQSEAHPLIENEVTVLYDTAPAFFGPASRARFVQEVLRPILGATCEDAKEAMGLSPPPAWVMETDMHDDNATNTSSKGLFIVGATSWTADDNYTMVVEALARVDKRLQQLQQREGGTKSLVVKPIWLLVTGKGVSRERFERAVLEASLSPLVTVTTMYFQSYLDYATALGAADVGLCLHHSSSGLDLPMKAVDMLGSGLPVIALQYEALPELLDEKHGWMFTNAEELETILWQLTSCEDSVSIVESVEQKRLHVMQSREKTWDERWRFAVVPLLRDLL